MLDAAHKEFFTDWALKNNYVILDSSSNDRPNIHAYAKDQHALVVPCPTGRPGRVVVVRSLTKE